jgi:hypothetical protein
MNATQNESNVRVTISAARSRLETLCLVFDVAVAVEIGRVSH